MRAADYLRAGRRAPAILIGHSLGGAAVLAAAPGIPEAKLVATIGAPADPAHVGHLLAEARPEIEAKGEAEAVLARRRFRITKQLLTDLEGPRLDDTIPGMRKEIGRADGRAQVW